MNSQKNAFFDIFGFHLLGIFSKNEKKLIFFLMNSQKNAFFDIFWLYLNRHFFKKWKNKYFFWWIVRKMKNIFFLNKYQIFQKNNDFFSFFGFRKNQKSVKIANYHIILDTGIFKKSIFLIIHHKKWNYIWFLTKIWYLHVILAVKVIKNLFFLNKYEIFKKIMIFFHFLAFVKKCKNFSLLVLKYSVNIKIFKYVKNTMHSFVSKIFKNFHIRNIH